MSAVVWLGIGLLGGVGAVARTLVTAAVHERVRGSFPWGTFAVNISGALLLGVVVGAHVHGSALVLAGAGALGSFTTFSTWMLDSERLAEQGLVLAAALNVFAAVAAGLGAAEIGRLLGGL